jgi:hypothetical protein
MIRPPASGSCHSLLPAPALDENPEVAGRFNPW